MIELISDSQLFVRAVCLDEKCIHLLGQWLRTISLLLSTWIKLFKTVQMAIADNLHLITSTCFKKCFDFQGQRSLNKHGVIFYGFNISEKIKVSRRKHNLCVRIKERYKITCHELVVDEDACPF